MIGTVLRPAVASWVAINDPPKQRARRVAREARRRINRETWRVIREAWLASDLAEQLAWLVQEQHRAIRKQGAPSQA